ncbi:small glutamine-rich tetratricopeptide repeat-containing protein alpha [Nasonia vitripennis]|uniref:SGTA homodimerisation domain-containing protein n=1 Tax=Nasonia vitripennis TaxID=7425 RepID=A0A7M7R4I9_NASVI|nr:small glutamine-rich tetratricopeptide repeat-containing protein alpha [Nasonia vitripennis]XP_031788693.1 small glutamine-rich tetratricopeptide repeat-containing protein alpha [Nasonia vitripennis]XP_031788694.1 small glutamine-rich tetratricopeptide repeat-containing protein alpha [Nasonia vitripennis]XP_032458027.1 small glutamine-rich tetratricopeptide repeat-containing protein alpha [Nasonia vitripennis]XP_032458028.1 small glutamine-rich tetratricopeptide repeat-containing protein alp
MIYKNLVSSIIKCLKQLMEQDNLAADARESLEVSIQCLESAYGVQGSDANENFDILSIYKTQQCNNTPFEATPDAKAEAERLKNEGNALMKNEKYHEALANYSKAIELDSQNAVYYCNRAAVYSKIGNHHHAIKDCNTALEFDPSYSKAYGRLGLAYTSLNKYKEAKENYRKALELEPDNESLKNNLQIAEEKLIQNSNESALDGHAPSNNSNMDLSSLLSNPALMNMARQMLSDPTMQNMMSNLMSGNVEQGGRMDALIEAGQQLAQQMQSANPDLIDSLRRQMGRNPNEAESSEK